MRVGFVQFDPLFGKVKENLTTVAEMLQGIRADLLVLPEFFNSGYQFTSREEALALAEEIPGGDTTLGLCALAEQHEAFIVAGLPERRGRRLYNSAVLVGPDGFRGLYRKAHLFYEEKRWFSPGNTPFRVWDLGSARIGVMICFDWFFPEAARTLALRGAQVICHPSNLVLPHCPEAMITRCLENRVFAVTANRIGLEARGGKSPLRYTGMSQVVDPGGRVLHRAPGDKPEACVVTIDPTDADSKEINPYNDLLKDRRRNLYF